MFAFRTDNGWYSPAVWTLQAIDKLKVPMWFCYRWALDKFSDWSCACQVFSSSVGIGLSRSLNCNPYYSFSSKFLTKKSRASEARASGGRTYHC